MLLRQSGAKKHPGNRAAENHTKYE